MGYSIDDVKWIDFKTVSDERGKLTSVESILDVPIDIKRIFYMHEVVAERGGHAHKETDQVIVLMSGSFSVDIFDGTTEKSFHFSNKEKGLYVPRLLFTRLYNFTNDAVCLVLANTHYDMSKSLRTMDDYLNVLKNNI